MTPDDPATTDTWSSSQSGALLFPVPAMNSNTSDPVPVRVKLSFVYERDSPGPIPPAGSEKYVVAPTKWPRVPGHEAVGRIDVIGEGVEGWAVGQRVGVGFLGGSCGHCAYCRDGDLAERAEFERRVAGRRSACEGAVDAKFAAQEIIALRPDMTALASESSDGSARSAADRNAAVALIAEVSAARALTSLPATPSPSLRKALGAALADDLGGESLVTPLHSGDWRRERRDAEAPAGGAWPISSASNGQSGQNDSD